jgi:hypothetical protein
VIILASTSDKVQVVTGAAGSIDVHASWLDNAAGVITPGRTDTPITTAATTDVVAAPASGTYRSLNTLQVRNKHASSPCDIIVRHTDGTNTVELVKATLLANSQIQYVDGQGFIQIPRVGTIISDTPPGSPTPGSMWWESDTGALWVYYNDGTSSQWVQVVGGQAAGPIVQEVFAENTNYGVTSVAMAGGLNTIPQQTDGTEFLTATITPASASNKLLVEVQGSFAASGAVFVWSALFQDGAAGAFAARLIGESAADYPMTFTIVGQLLAGTTVATTIKLRLGNIAGNSAGIYLNGNSGGRLLGGAQRTTMTITEIAA